MALFRPALLALALTLTAPRALASDLDKQSYWFGFLLGSGITVCELYKIGLLTRSDADDWLKELFKTDPDVPRVSIRKAKDQLAEDRAYRSCPLPK
ncbi:MAG: hypothetical protein ACNA8O_09265 [Cyanobacteriota bacterium]|jgi:hypothetical protein